MYNYNVSRETIESLKNYQQLTLQWNSRVNLVSSNSCQEFWSRHIVDSLQLLRFINDKNIDLIDIGSGAGFPGLVLSIAGVKNVTLIESNTKKSVFLLQAAKLSSNKVEIINKRIEDVQLDCDILTSRACAHLNKIFTYTKNIRVSSKYLLLKGKSYKQELEIVKKNRLFNCIIHDSITSKEGKVLEINNLAKLHDYKDNCNS